MTKPTVSIIMPMYNTVQFVKAAFDSMLRQTFSDWELIVVDDNSQDGSYELASVLASRDSRIQVHRNEANLGIAKNRHKAVALCSGEYIGHVDSDDMLERWALEEVLTVFKQKPELGLVYTDFAQVGSTGKVEHYSASPDFDVNRLHQHGWRHFGIYKKSAYDATEGFNTKLLRGCEDGDLFMQIAERFPCYRVPKVLYFYRNHGQNTTLTMRKCDDCTQRMECNYMRVWAKSANFDPVTFTPLTQE